MGKGDEAQVVGRSLSVEDSGQGVVVMTYSIDSIRDRVLGQTPSTIPVKQTINTIQDMGEVRREKGGYEKCSGAVGSRDERSEMTPALTDTRSAE